jgi:transcriptional regulator with XRE-family HTH domain
MSTHSIFGDWLLQCLLERNLSQAEFARLAGITRSYINDIIRKGKKPSIQFCLKASKVLEIPLETLYQKTGILPNEKKESFDEINYLFAQLDEESRLEVADFIRLKLKHMRRRHEGEINNNDDAMGRVESN